jgi:galactonate dehydratase
MKITSVRTVTVGNPWKNWVFVIVETDEGVTGLGEATGGLSAKPIEVAVAELSPLYLDQDPCQVSALYDRMYKGLFLQHNPAVAGIEFACWDILGKTLNVPVWQLLGGCQRPAVRAYANGWYQGPREPQFFAERAAQVAEMGYTALKFDPFGQAFGFLDRLEFKRSMAIVEAVRIAVGDDIDILIEAHDRFSIAQAIEVGRALEQYRPLWLETPVLSTDIAATHEVARKIAVPVASGERLTDLHAFAALLDGSISIVQPEILNVGGLLQCFKVAALAESRGAFVAPHNAQSPFTTVVNLHLAATIPNFLIQECFDEFLVPWSREILTGTAKIEDGYLVVPRAPGFGLELDEQLCARYPYNDRNFLRLFQSGWEQRIRSS